MGILRMALLALGVIAAGLPKCRAEQFEFDLPELIGSYQTSSRKISLDLGMEFSSISDASMRLTGSHIVGSFSDLNFAGSFPYPAEVSGWLTELKYAGFDSTMSSISGHFDKTYVRLLHFKRPVRPRFPVVV